MVKKYRLFFFSKENDRSFRKIRPLFLAWDHVEPSEAALKTAIRTFNLLALIEVHVARGAWKGGTR